MENVSLYKIGFDEGAITKRCGTSRELAIENAFARAIHLKKRLSDDEAAEIHLGVDDGRDQTEISPEIERLRTRIRLREREERALARSEKKRRTQGRV